MKSHALVHDRDRMYGRDFRVATAASLVGFIGLFLFVKQVEVKPYVLRHDIEVVPVSLPDNLIELPRPVERPAKVAIPIPAGPGDVAANTVGVSTGPNVFAPVDTGIVLPVVPYYKLEVRPKLEHSVIPEYPEMARMAGIEGKVVVEMLLETDGSVSEARVQHSSGNRSLDDAAVAAARQCRFSPGIQGDRPVRVWVSMPFKFSLQ